MSLRSNPPSIASANSDENGVKDLHQQLQQFNDLHQAFMQALKAYRDSVAQTPREWLGSWFSSPPSSAEPNSHTKLVPTRKDTERVRVERLNAFLAVEDREKKLTTFTVAIETLLRALIQVKRTHAEIENQVSTLALQTKQKFQEEFNQRQSTLIVAQQNVASVFSELEQVNSALTELKVANESLTRIHADAVGKVADFAAKATQLDEENKDKSRLIKIANGVPLLTTLQASVPVQFQTLQEVMARELGRREGKENWKKNWQNLDTFTEEGMAKFSAAHADFVKDLKEKKELLEHKRQTLQSINLKEIYQQIQALKAATNALPSINFNRFRKELSVLLETFIARKKTLTPEEKEQQLAPIKQAFTDIIAELSNLSKQRGQARGKWSELVLKMNNARLPAIKGDEIASVRDKMFKLGELCDGKVPFAFMESNLPEYVGYLASQHLIIMLENFKSIVPKEVYAAICAEVGLTHDISLKALIEKEIAKRPKNNSPYRGAQNNSNNSFYHNRLIELTESAEFNQLDVAQKLQSLTNVIDLKLENDDREKAQKILAAGREFLQKIKNDFFAEVKKAERTNAAVQAVLEEMEPDVIKLHDDFTKVKNNFTAKKQLASQYDEGAVNLKVGEQQALVVTQTAELESRWVTQPAWDKNIFEALNTRSKSIINLVEMQRMLQSIIRLFNEFGALSFTPIPAQGATQVDSIVEQFNQLLKLANEIQVNAQSLLENDCASLKKYKKQLRGSIQQNAEYQTKLLQNEFENACQGMKSDIPRTAEWRRYFIGLAKKLSSQRSSLVTYVAQEKQLEALRVSVKESYRILKQHHQPIDEPLRVLATSQRANSQLSLTGIRDQWLHAHVVQFEEDCDQYDREVSKHQAFLQEAKERCAQLKKHDQLTTEAGRSYRELCKENESVTLGKEDKQKILLWEEEYIGTRKEWNAIIDKNDRILELLDEFQNKVLGVLAQHDPTDPQSLALSKSKIIGMLSNENNYVWRMIKTEQQRGFVALDGKNARNLEKLKQLKEKLTKLLDDKLKFASYIPEANYLLESESMIHGFLLHIKEYVEEYPWRYKDRIDNAVTFAKEKLLSTMRSALVAPFEERIKPEIIAVESALNSSCEQMTSTAADLSRGSNRLNVAFEALMSDVAMVSHTPFENSNNASAEVVRLLEDFHSRGKLPTASWFEVASMADQDTLTAKVADALRSSLVDVEGEKKSNALMMVTECKNLLEADLKKCTDLHSRLEERKNENVINIARLEAQKKRQQSIQAQHKEFIIQSAIRMLGEKHAGQLQATPEKLNLVRIMIQEIITRNDKLKRDSSELEKSYQAFLKKVNNDYPKLLEKLSEKIKQASQVMETGISELQENWAQSLEALDKQVSAINDDVRSMFFSEEKELRVRLRGNLSGMKEKSIENFVEFPKDKREHYQAVAQILNEIFSILSGLQYEFFKDLCTQVTEKGIDHLLKQELKLNEFYQDQMKISQEVYHWLMLANKHRAFGFLSELKVCVSKPDMLRMQEWIECCAQPLLQEYKELSKREETIAALTVAIAELEAEQRLLDTLSLKSEVRSQAPIIQEKLQHVKQLETKVSARCAQIQVFRANQVQFEQTQKGLTKKEYDNVTNITFLRFRHRFLTDPEVKEILVSLNKRADEHKKIEKQAAIRAFIAELIKEHVSLGALAEVIDRPIKDNKLNDKVSLETSRGGPTETCKLIRRLQGVMHRLLEKQESNLFLTDVAGEFALHKKRLSDFSFLKESSSEATPVHNIFDYYYEKIIEELTDLKTNSQIKRIDSIDEIIKQLEPIKNSNDDELAKLKNLQAKIKSVNDAVNASVGATPSKFTSDSPLSLKLKEQLERLDLKLASYQQTIRY